MDLLNMYFLKQTHPTHNWNIKLEWIVMLFHSPTLYHVFTQHQGTEWRRKYFNILSSSSSESFGDLGLPPTPGSSSASSPYPFCISVAWPWCGPSWTTKQQQQCQEHTHSYLHTYAHSLHPVTFTLLSTQPKPRMEWQQLGLVDGCLLATSVSLFLIFSQVLHSSFKEKNIAYLL